jgi:hypothetical protein
MLHLANIGALTLFVKKRSVFTVNSILQTTVSDSQFM